MNKANNNLKDISSIVLLLGGHGNHTNKLNGTLTELSCKGGETEEVPVGGWRTFFHRH